MEFSGMICVSWLKWAGWHLGDIRRHPKASGGQLGSIWEVSGRHLGGSWEASGKCLGGIWEAYGECHDGLAWIGCASTSCVHWHHIESNPVAEAPLAMLGWSGHCVVALKATTAFAPHSHVTSQPFGGVQSSFVWPCLAELACQVRKIFANGKQRGLVWLSSAYFCQTKLLA